jgi:UDP-N-acetylglucosamine 2-epimerase (non-hydrolysing)
MPEEHNRVLTDHASDLLLAPTELAMHNLRHEGLSERALLVGDVMTDVCLRVHENVRGRRPAVIRQLAGMSDYVLATVHRPENTDDACRLRQIVQGLQGLDLPVLLAAHPRLTRCAETAGIALQRGAVRTMGPLRYPDMVAALDGARALVTDSGGLQKEAYLIGTPCTTVRSETEWPETFRGGWNVLFTGDLIELNPTVLRPLPDPTTDRPYGDGHAADAVATALTQTSALSDL